jgi:hypothetical protein
VHTRHSRTGAEAIRAKSIFEKLAPGANFSKIGSRARSDSIAGVVRFFVTLGSLRSEASTTHPVLLP